MSQIPLLAAVRHVVLDLDGTVYTGRRLHPGVHECLAALAEHGVSHGFLTNNTARSRQDYVRRLRDLGLDVVPAQVHTPVAATVDHLRRLAPAVQRLFVLGTEALAGELREAGFIVTGDAPDAVVVGFDTTLTYERLCDCAYWITQGLPYVATHPDLICPTLEPTVLVDCGALCAALTAATGREPDAVLGKPDPRILEGIARDRGVSIGEVAMVGDRLMTDIAMANRAGAVAVLVLTGETTRERLATVDRAGPEWPAVVVADLAVLRRGLG